MAAEKMIDKMQRMITKPVNIRNICTSAHIHHGKCVAPQTRLLLGNGSVIAASELYSYAASRGKKVQDDPNQTVYEVSGAGLLAFSLNKETGKLEQKEISHAWKLSGGSCVKIRLRNGHDITTTPEHKYLVFEEMDFVEKEAGDLKLGDRVVCARELVVTAQDDLHGTILEQLAGVPCYAILKPEAQKRMFEKIKQYGTASLAAQFGMKVKSFYHGAWQGRYSMANFLQLGQLFSTSAAALYDSIATISFRSNTKSTTPISLPKQSDLSKVFFLAGLMFGDGSGHKFIVGKPELEHAFRIACEALNIRPVRRDYGTRTPELLTNYSLVYFLHALFAYPFIKKSHSIAASSFLFKAPTGHIAHFLKGYFDCDGTVEKGRSAISLTSVSYQMLKDVQLLLLRFGIVAIRQGDTIYISGNSARIFGERINFTVKEKQQRALCLIRKTQGSIVTDVVPLSTKLARVRKVPMASIDHHYYKYEQGTLTPTLDTVQKLKHQFALLELNTTPLDRITTGDLAYIEVVAIEQAKEEVVYDFSVPEHRNFVAEGIVIHNTAFTDNLLAAAGLMSEAAAGELEKGMATWQHADEQERLMTVDAANVSMVHTFRDEEFLINLIDTPGHVDFGGNVTRAMRAIDGTVVLVCASEGIMPQTETVLKQALRERVKPVLFINKVDRLIKELQLTPQQIQERFTKIIVEFNRLIEDIAESQFKEKWKVSINDGSVSFGSARDNWALSLAYMQKKGVGFKDILKIYELSKDEREKWVWQNAPLSEVILDMVISHLPNPLEAQKYRVERIWRGDYDSQMGKDLLSCNPNGKLAFCITRILIDPRSGREICAGRLYSGTITEGMQIYCINAKQYQRLQNVYMYVGIKTEGFTTVPAGNVLAIAGIAASAGETITTEPEQPFEELKHIFEPVITKSISVPKPQDLPKLVEVLRKVVKEDPSIKVDINEETGEVLMHGMGELHLEIIENRIKTEKGVSVVTSPPIVVYREAVTRVSPEVEGKSPNKHNKFYFVVEPLEEPISAAIKKGDIPEGRVRKKDEVMMRDKFVAAGMDSKQAQKIKNVFNGNVFVDETRGQVHIGEVIEMILDMFEDVMKQGPLSREPCVKVKVKLTDMKLHEDAIHRGPAQTYPAVREGIKEAIRGAGAVMYEPLQILLIEAPVEHMGDVSKLVSNRRGQLLDMEQEGSQLNAHAKMPVAELFGWSSDLRSATSGRGVSSLVDQMFEKAPAEQQEKIVRNIRGRKKLSEAQ